MMKLALVLLGGACIIIGGVLYLVYNYPPSTRYTAYYKNGMVFRGRAHSYFQVKYETISFSYWQADFLGEPHRNIDVINSLIVRLDGVEYSLDELDVAKLLELGAKQHQSGEPDLIVWTLQTNGKSLSITTDHSEQAMSISFSHGGSSPERPRAVSIDMLWNHNVVQLPLSGWAMRKVFGRPDRIEVLRWVWE